MMDSLAKALKSKIRGWIGVERAIFLAAELSRYGRSIRRLTRFARPGYWAGLREYNRLISDGYRYVRVSNSWRIGHLCAEVDALLKDRLLRGANTTKLILVNQGRFANPHIVKYFERYLSVEKSSPVFRFAQTYGDPESAIIETHPYAVSMYGTAKAYEIYAKWGDRPPLFEISDEDHHVLRDYLSAADVPADAWYVCVHAREGGYSPEDETIHRYRSVDIATFSLAIDEIVKRGGWCVRVGDASMRPHPPHEKVIDYALSPKKSPQLDVALAAGCRLFLGSASGLFNLAELFGRPCVIAHISPLSCAYGFSPIDISIPQRLRDRQGNYLSLSNIMKGQYSVLRFAREFEARGLENVPNTREDIRDAVVEMLDRLDGKAVYTDDDIRRQEEFRSLFHEGHYAFGATSSIGRDFLRKYGG